MKNSKTKCQITLKYPGYYTLQEAATRYGSTHGFTEDVWRGLFYRGVFDDGYRRVAGKIILLPDTKVDQITQMSAPQRGRLMMGKPHYICTTEVNALFHLHSSAVWRWVKNGVFPQPIAKKYHKCRWWDIRKLIRFANEARYYIDRDFVDRFCQENLIDKGKMDKLFKQAVKPAKNVQRLQ